MDKIFKKIAASDSQHLDFALCLITRVKGSTPRKASSKMIVYSDGSLYGTIGGGSLENQVVKDAVDTIKNNQPAYFEYNLEKEFSMSCGGYVEIYIEPIQKSKPFYIFGAGHIGKNLALQAQKIGFKVTLIDERESIFNDFVLDGSIFINKNHNEAFQELEFNEHVFIASITHQHGYDYEVIGFCAKQKYAYLGMIGSERKVEKARKSFLKEGSLTEEQLNKIDWPMGISIACQTPEEIVISILAKLIDVRGKLA